MRIGFKTNIEEELIYNLKIESIKKSLNVNDILEDLISNFLEGGIYMTLEEVQKIERNFKEIDWTRISNDIIVYNKNLSLCLRYEQRKKDYEFQETYSDLLVKYNIGDNDFYKALFIYNGNIVYINTLFKIDKFFIPIPVGLNLLDTFYENEIKIAKILSENPEDADKFFINKKIIKRNF